MGSDAQVRGRSFSGLDEQGTDARGSERQEAPRSPYLPVSSPDGWTPDIVGELTLNELATNITLWREAKGFPCPTSTEDAEGVIVKLALVITEASEAIEAVRAKVVDEDNFREEIADTFIRLFDLAGAMDIDLTYEISEKMQANCGRPKLHGKRA